jgi:Predicted dehydrogenases and related proteins
MIRFAVVGIGRMGERHAENLAKKRVKGARLVAVADLSPEKLKAFCERYKGVAPFLDYKEMFEKVKPDAVVVATPHYSHVPIAIDAMKAGINPLSEKPAAVSVSEAARAIAESEKYKELIYGIVYNQRTNRMYRKAKELLDSGVMGKVKRVNFIVTGWYRAQCYYNAGGWRATWNGEGGGILINQCVHQLDILTTLLGLPERITASARTVNRNITVENEVQALIEYPGFKCQFTALGHELKGVDRLEIACDKGRIVIENYKMKYYLFKKSEGEVNAQTKTGYGSVGRKKRRVGYGFFNAIRDITLGQQINILRNYTKALECKTELVAPGADGIKALELINGIYLSAYKKAPIGLPLDPAEYDAFLEEMKKKELENARRI